MGVDMRVRSLAFLTLVDLKVRAPSRQVDLLLIGLAIGYGLVSNYLTQLFPVAGTPLNVLQSYQLFGGLVLLGVLVGLRSAMNPAAQGTGPHVRTQQTGRGTQTLACTLNE